MPPRPSSAPWCDTHLDPFLSCPATPCSTVVARYLPRPLRKGLSSWRGLAQLLAIRLRRRIGLEARLQPRCIWGAPTSRLLLTQAAREQPGMRATCPAQRRPPSVVVVRVCSFLCICTPRPIYCAHVVVVFRYEINIRTVLATRRAIVLSQIE